VLRPVGLSETLVITFRSNGPAASPTEKHRVVDGAAGRCSAIDGPAEEMEDGVPLAQELAAVEESLRDRDLRTGAGEVGNLVTGAPVSNPACGLRRKGKRGAQSCEGIQDVGRREGGGEDIEGISTDDVRDVGRSILNLKSSGGWVGAGRRCREAVQGGASNGSRPLEGTVLACDEAQTRPHPRPCSPHAGE